MLSTIKLQKKKTFFKRCKAYFWDCFGLWGINLVVAALWEMPYKFFKDSVIIHFLFNPFPLPSLLDQPSLAWYKWIVGICGVGFIGGFFNTIRHNCRCELLYCLLVQVGSYLGTISIWTSCSEYRREAFKLSAFLASLYRMFVFGFGSRSWISLDIN